ncbi:MAG: MATE family efflux transporter [Oscillospiraceae bacterium]|nr:MATE family efflux transporter [Oscillospiraceae bacterium]
MKDLTKGSPIRLIITFALPLLLGNIFQQAYSLTDTIIIGQQLGTNSLAAVGSTQSAVQLMFNIINGSVTGYAIIIANNFGAGDKEEMRRTIARSMTFSSIITAILIAVVFCFSTQLLKALDTPDSIFGEAKLYLCIVAAGLVVTLIYNLEASILRAVGDSVIPLIILIISTALNIGLDLLLVCVFHTGVAGAALATVAAQLISAVVCFIYLVKRRPFLMVKPSDFKFTLRSSLKLLSSGFGMALMYSIIDIGSIILQNGINGFGEDIIAAHVAARKIFSVTIMPFSAISATMITYCSQNMGAHKYSRIKRGVRDGMLINISWATIAVAMVYFGGNFLVGLIVPKGNAAIVDTAVLYLRIAVLFYYCLAFLLGLRCALQGLGKSFVPIVASIIEMLWKVATVLWIVPLFGGKNGVPSGDIKEVGGYFGIMISEPIIWTVCAVLIAIIAVITLKRLPEDTADNGNAALAKSDV